MTMKPEMIKTAETPEEEELFDMAAVREDIRKARRAALKAGAPAASVILHENQRVTIREWPDGRVERLVAGSWEEWPERSINQN